MHVRKAMRRRGPIAAVLPLVLLVAALVDRRDRSRQYRQDPCQGRGPVFIGKGGGFGEVYRAKASTLAQTLFQATLLPSNPAARNIALAGLGRAERTVNHALALRCWKNNGCNTGTGGKLTVAYIEQFGENVYRQMSKMEFILQALTYKDVGRIIYKSAHSDLNQGIADFKAAIAQKVSLIVSYPDFGDAMLPVMKEATDAGIPVATYAWGYRHRARQELPDGRRRVHVQPRQGVRRSDEHAGQAPATSPSSAASRATRCRRAGRSARSRR